MPRPPRSASPKSAAARLAPPSDATRRETFLPLLLAATLAWKAVVLAQLDQHPLLQPTDGLDSEVYLALARRVAAGDLGLAPEPFFVAPLYAYFLGAVLALTGGLLLAAKSAQIALGVAAVALVHATTRRFGGTTAARVAATLTAFTGFFTFAEITLLQAALDPFLTALTLYLLARALQDDTPRAWLASGLSLGLFALNRPNVLGAAGGLVALLALVALTARSRARLMQAGLLTAGLAVALAPSLTRNLVLTGEPILIASHGGLNLYIGNNGQADGTYRRVPGVTPNVAGQAHDARRLAEQALGRTLSARETSAWFAGRALEWMRARPADALHLFARKLAYVFNAVALPLNHSIAYYALEEPSLLRVLRVGPGLLLPLGLLGLLVHARRADASFRLWAACVPLYALSVAVFFVAERYRQALLVPLAVGAGLACEQALRGLSERAWPRLARGAALLLALALATHWDFGLDDGRATERAALVEALVDAGRLDEASARIDAAPAALRPELLARAALALQEHGSTDHALVWLERAAASAPERADVRFALGAARLAAGDAAGALAPLQAAVQAEGPDAWRAAASEKLGIALGLLGRSDEALRALERACALAPRTASAHHNRAVILIQLDRLDEARRALDEALRIDPGYVQARALRERLLQTATSR